MAAKEHTHWDLYLSQERQQDKIVEIEAKLKGLLMAHHVTRQMAEVKVNDIIDTAAQTLEAHQRDPFAVVLDALWVEKEKWEGRSGHTAGAVLAAIAWVEQVRS